MRCPGLQAEGLLSSADPIDFDLYRKQKKQPKADKDFSSNDDIYEETARRYEEDLLLWQAYMEDCGEAYS